MGRRVAVAVRGAPGGGATYFGGRHGAAAVAEPAAMERPEVVVTLGPDEARVEVPSLGLGGATPLAVGLLNQRGRVLVASVGDEALAFGATLPDGTPVLPWRESAFFARGFAGPPDGRFAPAPAPAQEDCCVVVNPLRAETFDLQLFDRVLAHALAALLAGRSWLGHSRDEVVGFRYVVRTRGVDVDDALKDAVALALTSYAPGEVTVDGERWYGPYAPSPPDWTPPRVREDPLHAAAGAVLYGMLLALAVARWPARGAAMIFVVLLAMAARDGWRVWRYYRRERERAAQRARHP